MKFITAFSLLTIISLSSLVNGQTKDAEYLLRGTVSSKDGKYIPALSLSFRSDDRSYPADSNENGSFNVRLPPGLYEVTSRDLRAGAFRGVVLIQNNALNPQDINFVIDGADLCLADKTASEFPEVIKSVIPRYPAAGKAVRATGTVSIAAVVDSGGKVVSADALSGHPLLRAGATEAAKGFIFAADSAVRREVLLHFIFIFGDGRSKPQSILQCPNRILTIGEPVIINTTESAGKNR